jgi:catechol 2,3-dioxygenase-like lactoylglutathione lyase family enzyme
MIVSRLAHIAFAVPDVGMATDFYRDLFGLEVVGDDGNYRFLAGGRSRTFELAFSEGEPTMEHFAFSVCGPSALAEARASLQSAGVEWSDVSPGPGIDAGVAFALPTGHMMRLVDETDPAAFVVSSVPVGEQRRGVGPVPIEHATLHAQDIRANAEFLTHHLGLRISESIRPANAPRWGNTFLRAGQMHHDLGMIVNPEDSPGLHHFCFAVPSVAELVRVSDALALRGIALDASMGRHTSGNNVFIYFKDPFGARVEVNTDMARVDAAAPTLVRDRPAAFDVWREGRPPAMTAGSPARDARTIERGAA